jgi:hypothetical protein
LDLAKRNLPYPLAVPWITLVDHMLIFWSKIFYLDWHWGKQREPVFEVLHMLVSQCLGKLKILGYNA